MSGSFEFEIGGASLGKRVPRDRPFRVLFVADFSGRAGRGFVDEPLGSPVRVDIDSFQSRLRQFAPTAMVETAGVRQAFEIHDLDSFHPDHLVQRLDDPTRASRSDETTASALGSADAAPNEGGSDFERLMAGEVDPAASKHPNADIESLVRKVVEPHIVRAQPTTERSPDAIEALTRTLRGVLRAPELRSLEVTWRSAWWWITRLDVSEDLELWLLDADKERLAAAMRVEDAHDSALFRLLADPSPGEAPWALWFADCVFGPDSRDVALLELLGAVSAAAQAPFLAGAAPALLGCESFTDEISAKPRPTASDDAHTPWSRLRRSLIAPWIGLVAPRFLLRHPFGARTKPIESFAFEEVDGPHDHDGFCWANGAIAVAHQIAKAFEQDRWGMQLESCLDIRDLPSCSFDIDGEKVLMPSCETRISDAACARILECGVIPLMSHKSENSARIAGFAAVAEPLRRLAGPWQ